YTFLLDPVGYKGPEPIITAPTTVAKPEAAPAPAASAAPVNAPAPAQPVAAAPTPAPTPAAAAPTDATPAPAAKQGDDTYKVKQGDTLTEIAMAHKPQDVSLQQMLVALHRANEDAFIKKNMNLVRVGKILRIPDAASASQINQDEAVRVVNTQTREFIDYRAKIAEAVAAATL